MGAVHEIEELVDRETRAWDTLNVQLLLSVFHPDMVWPWPRSYTAHDPVEWTLVQGRFDAERWGDGWQDLFDSHELVHNRRQIARIEVSKEGDGAFAVVDVDTLWRSRIEGFESHWLGRTCKVYVRLEQGWKMTMQTGALRYDDRRGSD